MGHKQTPALNVIDIDCDPVAISFSFGQMTSPLQKANSVNIECWAFALGVSFRAKKGQNTELYTNGFYWLDPFRLKFYKSHCSVACVRVCVG